MIIAEKIIFNVIAFFLFVFIFFKMIRKNDTSYLIILVFQAIGISINFFEIILSAYENVIAKIVMYLFSIILPIAILVLENKGKNFPELLAIFQAKMLLLVHDRTDAKTILIKLVTKYPESYLGHIMLAEIYEAEGGMRKAIDEYVKAIDIKKNDYDSYYKIAYLLNELGKKDESATMLQNLLNKKADYYKASCLLGDILCDKEEFKEAINIYMDALKYSPNDYELYYGLGIAYTRLNDFQNAKICYEKAATINHEQYCASYNLAQISLIYRDLEKAEEYFTICLYSQKLEPKAYFELAKIYMLKNEREKAITFINKAIELDVSLKEKAEEEPIFIPIRRYMQLPQQSDNEEQKENETTLSKKEKDIIEYLEKTYLVVTNLNLQKLGKETKLMKKQKENEKELGENY